ncbi:MAG: hypothetical protein Q9226_006925 [Calogaya cf. arnoldii]
MRSVPSSSPVTGVSMPANIPLKELALELRDHIVGGTFDGDLVNSYLRPYAEIVLAYSSSSSTRNFGRFDRSSQSGTAEYGNTFVGPVSIPIQNLDPSFSFNYNALQVPGSSYHPYDLTREEPAYPISNSQSPAPKRRRLLPRQGPNVDESSGSHSSISIPTTQHFSESHVYDYPLPTLQQGITTSNRNLKSTGQQNTEQVFFDTWKMRIRDHPNALSALQGLHKFKTLPPFGNHRELTPYYELNRLMEWVSFFGSHQVQQNFVTSLRSLEHSARSTLPQLSPPPALDAFEPLIQPALRKLWKAFQISDFWHNLRHGALWRAAVMKKTQVFLEIMQLPVKDTKRSTQKTKDEVFKMFELGCPDAQEAEGMKKRFSHDLLASCLLFKPLYERYQSDGILAMMPTNIPSSMVSNKVRVDALLETLDLLKPEFRATAQLRVYSEAINKVLEGGRLTDEELDTLKLHSTEDSSAAQTSLSARPSTIEAPQLPLRICHSTPDAYNKALPRDPPRSVSNSSRYGSVHSTVQVGTPCGTESRRLSQQDLGYFPQSNHQQQQYPPPPIPVQPAHQTNTTSHLNFGGSTANQYQVPSLQPTTPCAYEGLGQPSRQPLYTTYDFPGHGLPENRILAGSERSRETLQVPIMARPPTVENHSANPRSIYGCRPHDDQGENY